MNSRMILLASSIAILPTQAQAGYDCRGSIDEYNMARSEISSYLKRYVDCLSTSAGRYDCSFEFRRLKNAQSSLEMAVSSISIYCRE